VLNIQYIIYHERNCRTIKTNKRNTNINSPNIKKQMIETIIILMCVIVPSFLLGYATKWMNEEQTIAKKIESNKQSNILPPI